MELRAAVGRLIRSIRVTASAAAGISVGAITSESTANVSLSHVEMAGLGLLAPPSAAFTAAGGLAHQILSFAQERFCAYCLRRSAPCAHASGTDIRSHHPAQRMSHDYWLVII